MNLRSKGFTLIEIVVVIVLVGILSGLATMIILGGVQSYSDEMTKSDVHYQARIAMERMVREIRLIRGRSDITTMTDTNLRFIDITGSTVGFSWVSPTVSRWNGAANDLLASNITAFDFNYYQQDGVTPAAPATVWFIEISMTSQQAGESLQMSTRVHPRNLY